VQVLSVDFGGKEWVDVSSLRQLPESLTDLPPFAVCCRLANIEPVKAKDGDSADWSQPAADYIINATKDMPFTAWLDESLPVGGIIRYCSLHLLLHLLDHPFSEIVQYG